MANGCASTVAGGWCSAGLRAPRSTLSSGDHDPVDFGLAHRYNETCRGESATKGEGGPLSMNVPPVEAVRVPPAALQQFVEAILAAVGMEAAHARLLAHLLVTNDLRGVFSHGTRQVATYAR